MNGYHLQYTIQSLRGSVDAMEFSPSGRFLVVGDGNPARLRVLDRLTRFCPTMEAEAISQPTSFAFENSSTFLVGLDDGRFSKYTIDLRSKRLVIGWTNSGPRGPSPVTAMALNKTGQTLALVAGPNVLVFIRVFENGEAPHRTLVSLLTPLPAGEFQFAGNMSSYFDFECGTIKPPLLPTSLCFTSNDQLHVAFQGPHIA